MVTLLEFERYKGEIFHQLLRRIGYTNGLHDIRRFARVVEYVYPRIPCSSGALAETIISEESRRTGNSRLQGTKYALGIVQVAEGLRLLERFGPKLSLTDHGYACHGVTSVWPDPAPRDALLLSRIIDTDGEYTLNILEIMRGGQTSVLQVGDELGKRFLRLIQRKKDLVEQGIADKYARVAISAYLDDQTEKLRSALEGPKVRFFLNHTVKPRVEWLNDLRLLAQEGTDLSLTSGGRKLLTHLASISAISDGMVILPMEGAVAQSLALDELPHLHDLAWQCTAATFSALEPPNEQVLEGDLLLEAISRFYPHVKLRDFNEAESSAIHDALSADAAVRGTIIRLEQFESSLNQLAINASDKVFRLSKRRGQGFFIALK